MRWSGVCEFWCDCRLLPKMHRINWRCEVGRSGRFEVVKIFVKVKDPPLVLTTTFFQRLLSNQTSNIKLSNLYPKHLLCLINLSALQCRTFKMMRFETMEIQMNRLVAMQWQMGWCMHVDLTAGLVDDGDCSWWFHIEFLVDRIEWCFRSDAIHFFLTFLNGKTFGETRLRNDAIGTYEHFTLRHGRLSCIDVVPNWFNGYRVVSSSPMSFSPSVFLGFVQFIGLFRHRWSIEVALREVGLLHLFRKIRWSWRKIVENSLRFNWWHIRPSVRKRQQQ